MSEKIAQIMELLTTCTNVHQLHICVIIIKQNILKIEPFFSVLVSGLNATDKTPIYEMPLITCFGFKVGASIFYLGFGQWHFVIGVLYWDLSVLTPMLHLRLAGQHLGLVE